MDADKLKAESMEKKFKVLTQGYEEQLAASHRINGLWEEVQKQEELEQALQRRYGNLMAELERKRTCDYGYGNRWKNVHKCDKGNDIPKTDNTVTEDAVRSSEIATESINPDSVSTKQESIQESHEAEGYTNHTEVDNSSVFGGDAAEKQTGMEQ
ncbi:hypothetical protein V6N13_136489 [Hibiscus sabdariffa]|uniref:Uncharacterized protein n=1 Tax=Hibiscus sabdariffa TaxID=183260 RepID=A0ABR2DPY8_9ROSI